MTTHSTIAMAPSVEPVALHLLRKLGDGDSGSLQRLLSSVVATTIAVAIWLHFFRPLTPRDSPKAWSAHDWPLLGSALSFYTSRRDFLVQGLREAAGGNFSFHVGKKHVVAIAGSTGRKTFFENRGLNFAAGFVELLVGTPFSQEANAHEGNWPRYFNKTLVGLFRTEMLRKRLPVLCHDVRATCDRLAAKIPAKPSSEWRVTEVFDTMYGLLAQMLARMVGPVEISGNLEACKKIIRIFERFENSKSTAGIIFPWLQPFTAACIMRLVLGTVLYVKFDRIIKTRKMEGRREEDSLQYLMDQDTPLDIIIRFEISALWGGLLSTGASGTYLMAILASNPEWKSRCKEEMDRAVTNHRANPAQSPHDVLDSLTLEQWESEFPVIDACLREAIRLALPGTLFRKNTSGADIPIGDTGQVIPNGSFAAYLVDEAHMNPTFYPDPLKFDPSRYLLDKKSNRKEEEPHTYVGWGCGVHTCLGTRLGKLEVTLMVAYVLAKFDIEHSDGKGNLRNETPPMPDRNMHSAKKPKVPLYIRYKLRD